MMNAEILLVLLYLTGRLAFYDLEFILNLRSNRKRKILWRMIIGLFPFLMIRSISLVIAMVILHSLLVIFDSFIIPKNFKYSRIIYLSHLTTGIIIAPILLNYMDDIIPIWPNLIIDLMYYISPKSIFISAFNSIDINKIALIFIGYIFTLKEGTAFIRLALNRIRALPKKKDKPKLKDTAEYERGKLIGILERTFIYFLVIFNQIGSIAVIVALKSLARFKELEDKNFAEYFLIGSLLSLLVAVIPAIIVKLIL